MNLPSGLAEWGVVVPLVGLLMGGAFKVWMIYAHPKYNSESKAGVFALLIGIISFILCCLTIVPVKKALGVANDDPAPVLVRPEPKPVSDPDAWPRPEVGGGSVSETKVDTGAGVTNPPNATAPTSANPVTFSVNKISLQPYQDDGLTFKALASASFYVENNGPDDIYFAWTDKSSFGISVNGIAMPTRNMAQAVKGAKVCRNGISNCFKNADSMTTVIRANERALVDIQFVGGQTYADKETLKDSKTAVLRADYGFIKKPQATIEYGSMNLEGPVNIQIK